MDKQQMEVKNFLMKAYYMDQRIDSKLEQMASLNELARKATSAVSDMICLEARTGTFTKRRISL